MRKFIFEIAVLFSLFIVSIYAMNNVEKPASLKKFDNIDKKIAILNFGNSHGGAFNYRPLTLPRMAVNRSANTLYYDLQNYKFMKKHLADSAIILLPVSYFSFGLYENREDRGTANPFVNYYYEYLPKTSIYSYSLKKDISLKTTRIQKNFTNIFNHFDKKKTSGKKKKIKKKKKKVLPTSSEHLTSLKTSSVKAATYHKKIALNSNQIKNVSYLKDIIVDAKESGYVPILVTTPYYQDYNQNFESEWLSENYYQFIDSISTTYNIPYINYNNDIVFCSNQTLFKNADHLNSKGRSAFSAILFKDLLQLGILKEEDFKISKSKK